MCGKNEVACNTADNIVVREYVNSVGLRTVYSVRRPSVNTDNMLKINMNTKFKSD